MPRLAGVNASSCKAVFHDLLPSSENCSLERGLVSVLLQEFWRRSLFLVGSCLSYNGV
ncbi:hypothetical protein IQ230_25190 [Gloeocapsopsis crepidinum LEGE 06123]|uniref:Uncharacterized protein n=1 Tax=Gloeocapsopsis crepidinum LEGE 06123 TaxID=588587 RepID=A0ABR9UZ10_9CHRO|nr:hypothetical protein [Gloeocapsopsis crepidinum LEGE 06123]